MLLGAIPAVAGAQTNVAVTQYSYDIDGRILCTTVRMNPAVFGSLPSDACALGTQGSSGPDRIVKNTYDAAGQVLKIQNAYGTPLQQDYATYTYSDNGKQLSVTDANGNRTEISYDGFDRQKRWIFPSKTSAGTANQADYEEYSYDRNGNRTALRKRDGTDIAYTYDNLGRLTAKNVDENNERSDLATVDERDVFYSYDLQGRLTSARFDNATGTGSISTYDGLGRLVTVTDTLITGSPVLAYQYDLSSNRTRITYPGAVAFDATFDALNRLATIKNGPTALVTPSYNNQGLVAGVDRYNAALDQSFGYDALRRLNAFDIGVAGQTNSDKVGWDYTRNPAAQIATEERDNDLYAWHGKQNGTLAYAANGLNQYSAVGGNTYCYDANGNLTDDGINVYKYDLENRLVEMRVRSISGCPSYSIGYAGTVLARLHYDPLGRLHEALKYDSGTGALEKATRFLHDGDAMVMEYDGWNTVVSRYLHGNAGGADDPLIWYDGSVTTDGAIRNLYADPRGSIVLVQGQDGMSLGVNTYDEWGVNSAGNVGRFQYTGQVWLDELGMYYYKARIYSPALGRFMQTDPIGYEDNINLYAYVANDPVNKTDPTGMEEIAVTGKRWPAIDWGWPFPAPPGSTRDQETRQLANQLQRGLDNIGNWVCSYLCAEKAPGDATDPNGAKAPGKPGEAEGFKDPPTGPKWQPGDKGRRGGWVDDKGNVWRPTGPGREIAHGGPHWDVTDKNGKGVGNVYPGGRTRPY